MPRVLLILFCCCATWANAEKFLVALEDADNRPYEYRDQSKTLTGFHIELVRAVASSLGWDVAFIALPWKRVISQLENNSVDAAIYVAASPEREAFAKFLPDNLLHVNGATLYIKKSRADEITFHQPLEAFADRWHIGFPDGYYMGERIQTLIDKGDSVNTATVNQSRLFNMLQTDRYDAVFGSITALSLAVNSLFRDELQALENSTFLATKMYIAFPRNKDSVQADQFAQAYRSFRKQPAYEVLIQQFNIGATRPTEVDFNALD
ncbi:substrate-binding periplasmic protein [Allohahella marinimesophila]|uniref:Transporter substrate-binding domain-containing protein n=1 Tax=Allohahella marinimesophila TaxID=1054972 RepID=A0ABP7NWB6_9GAMM